MHTGYVAQLNLNTNREGEMMDAYLVLFGVDHDCCDVCYAASLRDASRVYRFLRLRHDFCVFRSL